RQFGHLRRDREAPQTLAEGHPAGSRWRLSIHNALRDQPLAQEVRLAQQGRPADVAELPTRRARRRLHGPAAGPAALIALQIRPAIAILSILGRGSAHHFLDTIAPAYDHVGL